ncbi:alpha/beta fold hydrolase [Streptomyces pseudovenezuelae]|uniref:alpha/beta fold hydrolase n=1 Tax=Streptomyces pseudovenezuelae TaxID=67350 RepID=UPI0037173577
MNTPWPRFPHSNAVRVNDHETLLSELSTGSADESPAIIFVHSALLDRHAWYRTMHEIAGRLSIAGQSFTLDAYDLRGHGAASGESIVSIDQLAHDLLAVCSQLTTKPVHVVGLSLGGAVAQAAALDSPERITSLALLGTSSRFPKAAMYDRAARGRADGVAGQVDDTLSRWVSDPAADDQVNAYIRHALARTTPERWAQTWEALGRFDVADLLPGLRCPVLALAGTRDVASPPEALELIAKSVPDGTVEYLDAAHLSALERPSEVAVHVTNHLLRASGHG